MSFFLTCLFVFVVGFMFGGIHTAILSLAFTVAINLFIKVIF